MFHLNDFVNKQKYFNKPQKTKSFKVNLKQIY